MVRPWWCCWFQALVATFLFPVTNHQQDKTYISLAAFSDRFGHVVPEQWIRLQEQSTHAMIRISFIGRSTLPWCWLRPPGISPEIRVVLHGKLLLWRNLYIENSSECNIKKLRRVELLMTLHLRATDCQLPYGITQCYLPSYTSEHIPS